jgi:adenosylmethionine-8-amino-7-oxononanoate aminotransferase
MKTITGNVFPRRMDAPLPSVTSAKGVWIEDDQGQRYIDASGGAIVVNLGHGRERSHKQYMIKSSRTTTSTPPCSQPRRWRH